MILLKSTLLIGQISLYQLSNITKLIYAREIPYKLDIKVQKIRGFMNPQIYFKLSKIFKDTLVLHFFYDLKYLLYF